MEEWAEKFGWKKVAALFIIVAILILIFVIVSMFQSNSSETAPAPNQITPTQNGSGSTNGGSNSSGSENPSNPQTPSSFKKYSAKKFSFSYPSGYQVVHPPSPNGEEIVLLKGSSSDIVFHLYPGSTPASSIVSKYASPEFNASDFNVNSYVGKMYKGELKQNPIQQVEAVVLTSDFVIFEATLGYNSEKEDTGIEDTFLQIIKSIRFPASQ